MYHIGHRLSDSHKIEFLVNHQKQYPALLFINIEEVKRYEIFKSNMAKVKGLELVERSTAVYGATEFADLTGA